MANVRRIHMSGGEAIDNTEGTLFAWGYNAYGVGNYGIGGTAPSYTHHSSPTQVGSESSPGLWRRIAHVQRHTLAARADGKLFVWGENTYGELGLGFIRDTYTTNQSSSPVQLGTYTVSGVCTGENVSYFTTTSGQMWGMGHNNYGQLGTGNTTNYSSPVQMGSLTDWANSNRHAMASHTGRGHFIKANGTLWVLGTNGGSYGYLGIGVSGGPHISSPVQIGSGLTFATVDCGVDSSCAVTTAGALYMWGGNNYGKLGLGDYPHAGNGWTTHRSAPTLMGGGSIWADCQVGNNATIGLRSDGTLYSWGNADDSQGREAGKYGGTSVSSPVQIGTASNWTSISNSTSGGQAAAVNDKGEMFTWGSGGQGQLGHGDTNGRSLPTQVGTEKYWNAPECGSMWMSGLTGSWDR
jgi:alpha-tubulin suppressor-like RCC1 family protein